jgi:hypothetical protein
MRARRVLKQHPPGKPIVNRPQIPITRRGKVICALVLLVSGGSGAWHWSNTSAEQPNEVASVAPRPPADVLRRERRERIGEFKLVETTSPTWRVEFEGALGEATAKACAAAELRLDDTQRLKLITAISEVIAARATSSSEEVAAQLESRPGRWLGPDEDDKTWRLAAMDLEEITGLPVRREDTRGVFLLLDGAVRERWKAAIRGAAGEARAMHLRVGRTASREAIEDAGFDVLEQRDLWNGFATMRAMRLRIAEPTLDKVLEASRLVTYAHAWITLESAGGERYVWRSIWHWDAAGKEWVHHESFIQGGAPHGWYH